MRGDAGRLGGWDYVLDVTHGARAVARVALARAVTSVPEVRERPSGRRNVGDGDAQVILLPTTTPGTQRQVLVVDAARTGKIPRLLGALEAAKLVNLQPGPEDPIALVVASHPHQDHIGGMVELLEDFGELVAEFWDPGYFHAIPAYFRMMAALEAHPNIVYAQPTSGLRRWIGEVAVSVLAPSVQLRNRYDSYGTEMNDASISLRLEFPTSRFLEARQDIEEGDPIPAHPGGVAAPGRGRPDPFLGVRGGRLPLPAQVRDPGRQGDRRRAGATSTCSAARSSRSPTTPPSMGSTWS